jgi:hypothetical protein
MKFCVTPTSTYRSTPNVIRFHYEGDTKDRKDAEKLLKIVRQAMLLGVVLEVGRLEE